VQGDDEISMCFYTEKLGENHAMTAAAMAMAALLAALMPAAAMAAAVG